MTFGELARVAYREVRRPRKLILLCIIGIVMAAMVPSDLSYYRQGPASQAPLVHGVENYGRFVNTIAQVAIPFIMRDAVGVMQNIYIGLSSTFLTHGLKHLLNPAMVQNVRLGERPNGGHLNMPSGHSSMASCAMYFVARRYGWKHLIYLLPILLCTMYARVELDAHTWSAVIAGALVGILCSAMFTSKARPRNDQEAAEVNGDAGKPLN